MVILYLYLTFIIFMLQYFKPIDLKIGILQIRLINKLRQNHHNKDKHKYLLCILFDMVI